MMNGRHRQQKIRQKLLIEKIVTGDMGDKTKNFHFSLKLENGQPLTGTYEYEKSKENGKVETGSLSIKEGSVEITLSHRESITIKNLPSGTEYVLEEEEKDSQGYEVAYKENSQGKLENQDVKITVINTCNQVPVTGVVDNRKGILPLMSVMLLSGISGGVFSLIRRRKRV